MKQLKFDFGGKHDIPSFENWYCENSHERRLYGEKPYTKRKALMVYQHLVKTGFFRGGK